MSDEQEDIEVGDPEWGDEEDIFGDDEFGFGEQAEIRDDRHPAVKSAEKFAEGFKKKLFSEENIRKGIKEAMPKDVQSTIDIVDGGLTSAKGAYEKATKDIKPAWKSFKRSARAYKKTLGDALPKGLSDWIDEKLSDEDDRQTHQISEEQMQEDKINSTILETFARAEEQRGEEHQQQTVTDMAMMEQQGEQLEMSGGMLKNLQKLYDLENTIGINWRKKMLEYSMRQYNVMAGLSKAFMVYSDASMTELKYITKNTALPDLVKQRNSEVAKEMGLRRAITFASNSLDSKLGISDMIKRTTEHMGKVAKEKLIDPTLEMLGQIQMMLDMMGQMGDMGDLEFGPKVIESDGQKLANRSANFAGEILAGRITGKAAEKVKKFLEENPQAQHYLPILANFNAFSGRKLNEYLKNGFQENENDNPIVKALKWLGNKAHDTFELDSAAVRYRTESINLGSDSTMNEPGEFTNATNNAIVNVIPGFLARILQSSEHHRTGQRPDLLTWSSARNGFITMKDKSRDVLNKVFSSDSYNNAMNETINKTFGEENDLTEDEKDLFKQILTNHTKSGSALTYKDIYEGKFDTNGSNVRMTPELLQKLQSALDAKIEYDEESGFKDAESATAWRDLNLNIMRLAGSLPDAYKTPLELVRDGDADTFQILKQAGIIRDGGEWSHQVDEEVIHSYLRKGAGGDKDDKGNSIKFADKYNLYDPNKHGNIVSSVNPLLQNPTIAGAAVPSVSPQDADKLIEELLKAKFDSDQKGKVGQIYEQFKAKIDGLIEQLDLSMMSDFIDDNPAPKSGGRLTNRQKAEQKKKARKQKKKNKFIPRIDTRTNSKTTEQTGSETTSGLYTEKGKFDYDRFTQKITEATQTALSSSLFADHLPKLQHIEGISDNIKSLVEISKSLQSAIVQTENPDQTEMSEDNPLFVIDNSINAQTVQLAQVLARINDNIVKIGKNATGVKDVVFVDGDSFNAEEITTDLINWKKLKRYTGDAWDWTKDKTKKGFNLAKRTAVKIGNVLDDYIIKPISNFNYSGLRDALTFDLYDIRNLSEPLITVKDMAAGLYCDIEGNVIKNLGELKGNLYKLGEDGKPVLHASVEVMKEFLCDWKGVRIPLNKFKNFAAVVWENSKLGAKKLASFINPVKRLGQIKDIMKKGWTNMKEMLASDVYVGEEDSPRITRQQLVNGTYYCRGKPLTAVRDIIDDVKDADGNVVISLAEMREKGLFDKYGNPYQDVANKLADTFIMKPLAMVKAAGKKGWDIFKGLGSKLKNLFGNIFNSWEFSISLNSKWTKRIYELLVWKFGGQPDHHMNSIENDDPVNSPKTFEETKKTIEKKVGKVRDRAKVAAKGIRKVAEKQMEVLDNVKLKNGGTVGDLLRDKKKQFTDNLNKMGFKLPSGIDHNEFMNYVDKFANGDYSAEGIAKALKKMSEQQTSEGKQTWIGKIASGLLGAGDKTKDAVSKAKQAGQSIGDYAKQFKQDPKAAFKSVQENVYNLGKNFTDKEAMTEMLRTLGTNITDVAKDKSSFLYQELMKNEKFAPYLLEAEQKIMEARGYTGELANKAKASMANMKDKVEAKTGMRMGAIIDKAKQFSLEQVSEFVGFGNNWIDFEKLPDKLIVTLENHHMDAFERLVKQDRDGTLRINVKALMEMEHNRVAKLARDRGYPIGDERNEPWYARWIGSKEKREAKRKEKEEKNAVKKAAKEAKEKQKMSLLERFRNPFNKFTGKFRTEDQEVSNNTNKQKNKDGKADTGPDKEKNKRSGFLGGMIAFASIVGKIIAAPFKGIASVLGGIGNLFKGILGGGSGIVGMIGRGIGNVGRLAWGGTKLAAQGAAWVAAKGAGVVASAFGITGWAALLGFAAGAAVAGAAIYVGYRAWKYFKEDFDELHEYRLATYGVLASNSQDKANKILALEKECDENTKINEKTYTIQGDPQIDLRKWAAFFWDSQASGELTKTQFEQEQFPRFMDWYKHRFLPNFRKHKEAATAIAKGGKGDWNFNGLIDMEDMNNCFRPSFVRMTFQDPGSSDARTYYDYEGLPFADMDMGACGLGIVRTLAEKIKSKHAGAEKSEKEAWFNKTETVKDKNGNEIFAFENEIVNRNELAIQAQKAKIDGKVMKIVDHKEGQIYSANEKVKVEQADGKIIEVDYRDIATTLKLGDALSDFQTMRIMAYGVAPPINKNQAETLLLLERKAYAAGFIQVNKGSNNTENGQDVIKETNLNYNVPGRRFRPYLNFTDKDAQLNKLFEDFGPKMGYDINEGNKIRWLTWFKKRFLMIMAVLVAVQKNHSDDGIAEKDISAWDNEAIIPVGQLLPFARALYQEPGVKRIIEQETAYAPFKGHPIMNAVLMLEKYFKNIQDKKEQKAMKLPSSPEERKKYADKFKEQLEKELAKKRERYNQEFAGIKLANGETSDKELQKLQQLQAVNNVEKGSASGNSSLNEGNEYSSSGGQPSTNSSGGVDVKGNDISINLTNAKPDLKKLLETLPAQYYTKEGWDPNKVNADGMSNVRYRYGILGPMLKAVADQTGVPFDLLMKIVGQESAFKPFVSSSSAKGLFQFTKPTWSDMAGKYGKLYGYSEKDSVFHPVLNALTAAHMLKDRVPIIKKFKKSIGLPETATAGDLYMMHFAGENGWKKAMRALIANKDAPSSTGFSQSAINENKELLQGQTMERAVSNLYGKLESSKNPGVILLGESTPASIEQASTSPTQPKSGGKTATVVPTSSSTVLSAMGDFNLGLGKITQPKSNSSSSTPATPEVDPVAQSSIAKVVGNFDLGLGKVTQPVSTSPTQPKSGGSDPTGATATPTPTQSTDKTPSPQPASGATPNQATPNTQFTNTVTDISNAVKIASSGKGGSRGTQQQLDALLKMVTPELIAEGRKYVRFTGSAAENGKYDKGVVPEFKVLFFCAVAEYVKETSDTKAIFNVYSSWRDKAKQLECIEKAQSGYAAGAGGSSHQYGAAFDVTNTGRIGDSGKVAIAFKQGLITRFVNSKAGQKWGFWRPMAPGTGTSVMEDWHIENKILGTTPTYRDAQAQKDFVNQNMPREIWARLGFNVFKKRYIDMVNGVKPTEEAAEVDPSASKPVNNDQFGGGQTNGSGTGGQWGETPQTQTSGGNGYNGYGDTSSDSFNPYARPINNPAAMINQANQQQMVRGDKIDLETTNGILREQVNLQKRNNELVEQILNAFKDYTKAPPEKVAPSNNTNNSAQQTSAQNGQVIDASTNGKNSTHNQRMSKINFGPVKTSV